MINYKFKTQPQNLRFGQLGLILTKPLFINSKKMFRLKLFLKKSARRTDKTSRRVWINTFPHIPLTKKVIGSRMGKGKGSVDFWAAKVKPGRVMFEIDGVNDEIAREALRLAAMKLPIKSRVVVLEDW